MSLISGLEPPRARSRTESFSVSLWVRMVECSPPTPTVATPKLICRPLAAVAQLQLQLQFGLLDAERELLVCPQVLHLLVCPQVLHLIELLPQFLDRCGKTDPRHPHPQRALCLRSSLPRF